MSTTKILTYVFGLTSIILTYVLYRSINDSIQETKRVAKIEAAVIEQLKLVREAQLAYKAVNGSYTSDWDKLINFIDSGSFYLVERTETITTLAYGAESVEVKIDTVGKVPVLDSVFNAQKYPNFKLESLPYVPYQDTPIKFNMWADKITKAGVLVDVVEVWDPKPANPARSEDSELNTKKPLRFGSRTSVTTAGNWE